MPDDPHPVTVINQPAGGVGLAGSMGLLGWARQAGNLTAMAIIAGAFLWLLNQQTTAARVDRLDDRALFRESVHDIQHEADRRAGEVKGALDANTAVMRELIAEMKAARHEGRPIPPSATPRPVGP